MLILIPLCVLFALGTSLRINCGGGKLGGIQGDALGPDAAGRFTGNNTSPVSIYTTYSFSKNKKLVYTILAPGTKDGYDLKLFFMEINDHFFGEGMRVFDVYVMGKKIEGSLDIFKKAGKFQSHVLVQSGVKPLCNKIWIELIGKEAMISGIDVFLKDSIIADAGAIQEGSITGPADLESGCNDDIPKKMPKVQTQLPKTIPDQPTSGLRIAWKKLKDDYPLRVFEASGTVMGKQGDEALVVFGGFKAFPGVTTASYQRKFTNASAKWTPRAYYPRAPNNPPGVTHMAQCVDPKNPDLIYLVGGYAGTHPGISISSAYEYNRITNTYTDLPNLPGDRSGGGCVVVREGGRRMLVYTGGVDRVFPNFFMHIDHSETFTLNLHLGKDERKWKFVTNLKNPRNHMAGVEACGRYFFVGGQHQINERAGNQNTVTEYLPDKEEMRDDTIANLPFGLGHISASVMVWKCGLIVVGGILNGARLSDNVLQWNPKTNIWKVIGKYPHKVATPVCGIIGDQIMCATGGDNEFMRNYVYYGKIET